MDVKPFRPEDKGKLLTAFFELQDNSIVVWGRVRGVDERGILVPSFEPVSLGLHSFIVGDRQVLARLIVNGKMETPECNYFGLHTVLESANFWERTGNKFLPRMTSLVLGFELGVPPPLLLRDKFCFRRDSTLSDDLIFHGLAVCENGRAWLLTGPNVEGSGLLLKELIREPGKKYRPCEFTFVPVGNDKPFLVTIEASWYC